MEQCTQALVNPPVFVPGKPVHRGFHRYLANGWEEDNAGFCPEAGVFSLNLDTSGLRRAALFDECEVQNRAYRRSHDSDIMDLLGW
jgi:hypothetical protein